MAALEDSDADVRAGAAGALGSLGNPEAKPALRKCLKDTAWRVLYESATALGNLQDVEAIPDLVELLRNGDKNVRGGVASALGAIGDPTVVGPLTEALQDQDKDVRAAAARALDTLADPTAVPALIAMLGDGDGNVRGAAMAALGGVGNAQALAAILPLVDGDQKDLASVAEALARTGNPAVTDALVRLLDKADRKENGPFWAAAGLAGLGDLRTVPPLLATLKDPDENTQTVAAFALGLMKQPEAAAVLAKRLGEKAGWRGMAAVVGLVRIDTPEAKAALQQGAKACPNPAVQRFAARALEAPIVEALGEVVRSDDRELAGYAVHILPYLKDRAAAPILAEARKHRKSSVRDAAREAARYLERLTGTAKAPAEKAP
jgi:HEAT repeat protein